MSIGLIFVIVLAYVLVSGIIRRDGYSKPARKTRNDTGYDSSLFMLSNPELTGGSNSDSQSHGKNYQNGGGSDCEGGSRHSGHHGGSHDFGGFGGHSDGGHSSGGDAGGGGDCGGGGD
ncbi:hypothetical protein G5B47_10495 [Paenibacillus sp. 7124]|uniref:Uncharacterized protein n=1 Tax=Paenibacillus apii TaxID=1850370 RepID=A0A6M1PKK5_9BACL|nr:hypothetical protein [Paenibacillus apii]NGM82842.1 hypothetical protein [Paenibacillus apii]NJJ39982.1 hypothetical protein [Paenibacillus apii]